MDGELQKIIDQLRAQRAKAEVLGDESKRLIDKLDEAVARVEQAKEMAAEIVAKSHNKNGRSRQERCE